MIQQHIYSKDITRPINGVIKADSKTELADEISEYVITAEQMQPRLLPALFKTLVPPAKPTCVWISGDFGSGKSHLLKILSYVLENELVVDDRKCAEIFADKANDDFELKGDIQKACRVPTESILFNIQEKLDGIGKSQIDPVLNIFLKEFNRKLGFDDKKPEIAEIERYFAKKGKTIYTGKRCNPRDLNKDPYSADELATHTKFTQTIAAVKALTPEQKAAYETAFANQKKYATLNGYIFSKEYEKIL